MKPNPQGDDKGTVSCKDIAFIVYSRYIHFMFDKVDGFQWDAGNARKNEAHNVSQLEAEDVFFNIPLLTLADTRHSQDELRFTAMGSTSLGRLLYVTFTLRENGRLIRVISARDMHRKERVLYVQETKTDS